MLDPSPPLLVLGCGFTGAVVAGLRKASGGRVLATTRSPERAAELAQAGIEVHVLPALTAEAVERLVPDGADVLVAFPPDGATDAAVAPSLRRARAIAYVSSTAVYGDATGRIDEATPTSAANPRAAARLAAEAVYRERGAVTLRAAGIYGPGRGLHLRLLRGDFRMTGEGDQQGRNVVSRIHVEDLARLALAALDRAAPGEDFVVADDTPVPQIEVVRWLCARLGLELPAGAPREALHETLRHDRAVDNAKIKRALGMALLYPSYREGFEACLAVEAASPALAGAARPPHGGG
ncbi:nucleoside-diphosphate-sugar epimerase [Sorangium cellulosum]|uniref:Nucleoside-diphosphate-sugar epimerase n=1 Tax=Sorangium cellulosum TaxID=56 RepID=A0A2L0ENM7_SORCE|nr:NAD-dependent epimerase/dehydratase family protein [Sorangium cellulosum]AUX40899.1 nucleoside-diphosphate-sugar epimerase [Sorangium cellulosum]